MECLICHKKFKALTNSHLKKHSTTPKEYEQKFGVKTVPNGWCSKENNPFYGKNHVKGKSKVKSKEYAKNITKRLKGKTYEELYGKVVAKKIKKIRSKAFSKENNPAWQGGIDKKGYSRDFIEIREIIRNRDNHKCLICGNNNLERKIPVHHINYDKDNIDYLNLVCLCDSCHMVVNFNREYWTYFLSVLIGFRYGNQQPSLPNIANSR